MVRSSPLIGITTRRQDTEARRLDVVDRAYAEAVIQAGGTPLLLPWNTGTGGLVALDGLLLTGGGDVDPRRYGHSPAPETGGVDADRDSWESELVHRALELALPVLGVCRGCQVLNVVFGGTLVQHLPDVSTLPHLVLERDSVAHDVQIEPGTQLFALEGKATIGTNSVHHQAIDRVGAGMRAKAENSSTIRPMSPTWRMMVSVQRSKVS